MRYETFDFPTIIPYWDAPPPDLYSSLRAVARNEKIKDIADVKTGGIIVKLENKWYTNINAAEIKGIRVSDSYREKYESKDIELLKRFKRALNYVNRHRDQIVRSEG